MEKRYAFLFALMITGLVASDIYLLSYRQDSRERVVISKILDGDTLDLEDGRRIRLANVNAPEKNQPLSELSIGFLKAYENKSVDIEIIGVERYGRLLAKIYSGPYLNLELVRRGFAHKYLVSSNEEKEFEKAELFALKNGLGIWNRSSYYGCLDLEIHKKDEFLVIENRCQDLRGLSLKDESTKTSRFDILAGQKVSIHSGKGKSEEGEIFLNSQRNIWNDDKDSVFIRDGQGLLVYYGSYGY